MIFYLELKKKILSLKKSHLKKLDSPEKLNFITCSPFFEKNLWSNMERIRLLVFLIVHAVQKDMVSIFYCLISA